LPFFINIRFAQPGGDVPKIKITGKEKISKQPLEYATITFNSNNPKPVAGGITNATGDFDIEVKPGNVYQN
jgi:hypothetical protein